MNKYIKNKETDLLFEHMLKLKTVEDYYAFFEDIATIQEIKEFTQRFHVARLLKQGTTYVEIERITKASATTISRVNKALQYGAGGYQKVLK
ncbi:MAG: YerC/YecD family TrpR-related protein [Candidatus Izemoplasmataceae bacterium]|jgi:TrpR-related protein YerC/YecD